jgi:hypothetical protein
VQPPQISIPLEPLPATAVTHAIAYPQGDPAGVSADGRLTQKGRSEFLDGLTVEVNRQIEDKCFPAAIAAWIITLILIARFNITLAFIFAFVAGGIAFKIVKAILQDKYLRPIASLSDEMLVARYNEAKADRRAARTRTLISWAVIVILAVILAIAYLASHRQ